MRKDEIIENKKTDSVSTNKMTSCKLCTKGNCKNIKFRAKLNDFSNVYFCGETYKVIQYKKHVDV